MKNGVAINFVSFFQYSLKLPRPKTADSMKASLLTASGKHLARRASADQQKQVKFSEEGVINELRQPVKHQTSRHVARKDPPSPVAIVTMSPSVTKETVGMDEHQSRGFKYAVMTPAVAKQPKKSTRSAETAPSKGFYLVLYLYCSFSAPHSKVRGELLPSLGIRLLCLQSSFITFLILIFFSEITDPIGTNLGRSDH